MVGLSANPTERLNGKIKWRTEVVGIIPNISGAGISREYTEKCSVGGYSGIHFSKCVKDPREIKIVSVKNSVS